MPFELFADMQLLQSAANRVRPALFLDTLLPCKFRVASEIMQASLTLGAHAHSEGYSSCRVCMYVCMCVCVYV